MKQGDIKLTDEEMRSHCIENYGEPVDFSEGFDAGARYARQAQLKKVVEYIEKNLYWEKYAGYIIVEAWQEIKKIAGDK